MCVCVCVCVCVCLCVCVGGEGVCVCVCCVAAVKGRVDLPTTRAREEGDAGLQLSSSLSQACTSRLVNWKGPWTASSPSSLYTPMPCANARKVTQQTPMSR